jgi:hypothetical protein
MGSILRLCGDVGKSLRRWFGRLSPRLLSPPPSEADDLWNRRDDAETRVFDRRRPWILNE